MEFHLTEKRRKQRKKYPSVTSVPIKSQLQDGTKVTSSAAHYCRATLTSATWRYGPWWTLASAQAERGGFPSRRENQTGSGRSQRAREAACSGSPRSTGSRQERRIPAWRASMRSHRPPAQPHPGLQTHNVLPHDLWHEPGCYLSRQEKQQRTNKNHQHVGNGSYPWHPSACNQHFKKMENRVKD